MPETRQYKLLISDPSCAEGDAYEFFIPVDTSWFDIQTAVSVLYPETTSITLSIEEE